MSTAARSRLAAHAAAAGYAPRVLALIAQATLTSYQPGDHLADAQIDQVSDAVTVLAQAGYRSHTLGEHMADYRRLHGDRWRERFWTRAVAIASVRYRHPDRYGLSPCETDPARLAQHAEPARQPAPPSAARAA